jgi:ribosomal protein S12 methylthiotransferase accessory factor YcaO
MNAAADRSSAADVARLHALGILASDRMTDDDRGRRRYPERHHERQRCQVDRDLMRGDWHDAEPTHQQRDRCERAELDRHLPADRRAEQQHAQ